MLMDWMGNVRKREAPKTVNGLGPEQLCGWWCHSADEKHQKRRVQEKLESSLSDILFVMLVKYLGRAVEQAAVSMSQYFWEQGLAADVNVRVGRT